MRERCRMLNRPSVERQEIAYPVFLTLIGVAGYVVAVSSWIEHLLENPSEFRKASHYFQTVTKDRVGLRCRVGHLCQII